MAALDGQPGKNFLTHEIPSLPLLLQVKAWLGALSVFYMNPAPLACTKNGQFSRVKCNTCTQGYYRRVTDGTVECVLPPLGLNAAGRANANSIAGLNANENQLVRLNQDGLPAWIVLSFSLCSHHHPLPKQPY